MPIHISTNDETMDLFEPEPSFGSLSDLSLTPDSTSDAQQSTSAGIQKAKKRLRAVDPVEIMERLGLTRIK